MSTIHKIYIGDAETVLKKLPDNFFQLMVTSPPYWNVRDYGHKEQIGLNDTLEEYLDRLNKVWYEVARTLLPDGKIALDIGNIYYSEPDEKRRTTANLSLLTWQQLNNIRSLRFMGTIYWQKTTSRDGAVLFGSYPYPTNFMISNAVEPIHIFRKVGKREVSKGIRERSKVTPEEFRKFRDAIWNDINGVEDKHCAAYPVELPARLIKMFSYVEDWILDPFLGSGTTMKAARDLGRNSVGIELNPDYLTRIEEKVGIKQSHMFNGTKEAISVENLSVKLVSNPQGFNQVDKRWVDKYVEMWNIPENVAEALKLFTGEVKPRMGNPRDPRRMFLDEMDAQTQKLIVDFCGENKILIISDILKGSDEFPVNWVMVVLKKKSENPEWVLKHINHVLNVFGSGEVRITGRGSLKIGKITMQRKGGNAGRETSKMLQFKINPMELL